MGAALLPDAIAGAGLVEGGKNNKNQQNQANAAGQMGMGLANAQLGLFNKIMGLANANVGSLSADSQVANLAKDSTMWNAQQTQGQAAAMRTAGYQPGDSEVNAQLGAITGRNQLQFGQMANAIRFNAPTQQEALYGAAPGAMLGQGMNWAGGQQALHYGMMQNPGGFLSSLAPYLNPNLYSSGNSTQSTGGGRQIAGNDGWVA